MGSLWRESGRYRWFSSQKTNNAELWCFLFVSLNKLLNKQSGYWWFETLWRSCSLTLKFHDHPTPLCSKQNITVRSYWERWRLYSPASRLFAQTFLRVDQRKYQSSASLAFMRGIHRSPVDSPHKGPVRRNMFPFDDVIMNKPHIVGQTGSSVPPFSLHPSQRSHVDVSPLPNTSSAVLSEFPLEWVNLIPSSLPTFWCMWWTGTRHLSNRKPVIIFREPVGNVSSSLRLLRSAQSLDTHWLGVTFHW